MATTRYYLNYANASYLPATTRGAWNQTSNQSNYGYALATSKSAGAIEEIAQEGSTSNTWQVLCQRFITPALAGGEVGSTITTCLGIRDWWGSGTGAVSMMYAYVTAGDSDTVRGVLVNNDLHSSVWGGDLATCGKQETWTASPVVAQPGDHIVVEFGFRAQNTSSYAGYGGAITIGGTGSDMTSGGNASTQVGWMDFDISTGTAPTVITYDATELTATTALGAGEVTADGGATITERGVCISATENPTTADGKFVAVGNMVGAFTATLTGLTASTTYHARAYATNSVGTSYGADVTFTTAPPEVHIYAGGTTNGTDGTRVSGDGSGSAPIAFFTLSGTVTAHLRCDTGFKVPVTVTAPDYFECSADAQAWGGTCLVNATGANTPLHLRQTSYVPSGGSHIYRLVLGYDAIVESLAPVLAGELTLTPAAHSLLAEWDEATDASGIDHYHVTITDGATTAEADTPASPLVITAFDGAPLLEETTYTVSVSAVDVNLNESSPISASSKPLDTTAPTMLPGSLVVTAGDGKVTVTGTTASDARGIAGYIIEHGATTAYGTEVTVTTTATTLPATDISGTNGTLKCVRVSAFDAAGNRTAVEDRQTGSATPVSAGPSVVYMGAGAAAVSKTSALTLAYPAGVQVGDLLFACFRSYWYPMNAWPAGWTRLPRQVVDGYNAFELFYKVADSGDLGASRSGWAQQYGGDNYLMGRMFAYRGQSASGFLHASSSTLYNTNNTTLRAASVTTTVATRLIFIAGIVSEANVTPPSSPVAFTERLDDTPTIHVHVSDALYSPGTTGNVDAVLASATNSKAAFLLAVK